MTSVPSPERDATNITLVGSFSPRILHPAWFVRHDLLPSEAESGSTIQVVSNDFTSFETEWFALECAPQRLTFHTKSTPVIEAVRDLVVGVLKVLDSTIVEKIGLNTLAHYALEGETAWNRFGHRLVPKDEIWAPILERPGMRTVVVQGVRPDAHRGHVLVKVEPSVHVKSGVYIETNDEYVAPDDTETAKWACDILSDEWDASRNRASKIRVHLLGVASEGSLR